MALRGRRVMRLGGLVLARAAALALAAVACESGGTTSTGGMGGMSATGGTDAGSGDCPAGLEGPALVNVPAPAGSAVSSYCVDATEVTNAQYAAFLAASVATSGQDAWCAWNSYTPSTGWPATGKDANPVGSVDWCDAYAFCKWAGKRLCGKIGGGANAYADFADATKSEWYNACTAGGSITYPYGDTYDGTACNGADNGAGATISVGSKASCEGGYGGVYDLSGNVWEWEDSCNGTAGTADACRIRGGSFGYVGSSDLRCDYDVGASRVVDNINGGFRCCSASS